MSQTSWRAAGKSNFPPDISDVTRSRGHSVSVPCSSDVACVRPHTVDDEVACKRLIFGLKRFHIGKFGTDVLTNRGLRVFDVLTEEPCGVVHVSTITGRCDTELSSLGDASPNPWTWTALRGIFSGLDMNLKFFRLCETFWVLPDTKGHGERRNREEGLWRQSLLGQGDAFGALYDRHRD